MTDLADFTAATIEALYFTDTGDDGQPSSDTELAPETLLNLEADCRSFWHYFGCYVVLAECNQPDHTRPAQAGHDFWLTRNGHGAGFWDGDWDAPYSDILTEGSKLYGEFETYQGDDGLIYA